MQLFRSTPSSISSHHTNLSPDMCCVANENRINQPWHVDSIPIEHLPSSDDHCLSTAPRNRYCLVRETNENVACYALLPFAHCPGFEFDRVLSLIPARKSMGWPQLFYSYPEKKKLSVPFGRNHLSAHARAIPRTFRDDSATNFSLFRVRNLAETQALLLR